jgi:hypothetical protein
MLSKMIVLALLLTAAREARGQGHGVEARLDTSAAAPLRRWFRFVERDQFDSLPPLLAPDFIFESDGRTWDSPSFVAMIRGLGISHPVIELTDVETSPAERAAIVTYRRRETFQSKGNTRSVAEVGLVEMVRIKGQWTIRRWKTS